MYRRNCEQSCWRGGTRMLRYSAAARNARFRASTIDTSWAVGAPAYPPPMLIPCDAPLAEVVSAFLAAGDFTSSSRATYRRVLGELARDLGPQRPAASLIADELAAWFVRTRDTYAPATWNRDRVIVRSFVRDRKSTRLNSSHVKISYAVFCLKKKKT